MTLFSRFSFALAGLCVYLATTAEARILKRTPQFIEDWPLYQYHDGMTRSIPHFDAPAVDDLTVGDFDKTTGTLTWMCYKLVLGEEIDKFSSIIQKAEFGHVDGETPVDGAGTVVTKRSSGQLHQVVYGAKVQQSFDHPNILKLYHYLQAAEAGKFGPRQFGWAVMPYVEGSSLEKNFGAFADQAAVNDAFKQILSAVSAVAAAGVIHRDLKPENFLNDAGTMKLMDFDQARETATSLQFDVGTPTYQAPEILAMKTDTGPEYNNKVDTFSTAMTFLVLSVSDLQDETTRFQFWKDVIEMDNNIWPTAARVTKFLKEKNFPVLSGNDALADVLGKALCRPSERYDPAEFESAFNGVV